MIETLVDGLPVSPELAGAITLRACGTSALLRAPRFLARVDLGSGQLEWLVERQLPEMVADGEDLPRRALVAGADFWVHESARQCAEIYASDGGALMVSVRQGETGALLWEERIALPAPADWAEAEPAWPGAATEEIDAFLVDDPHRLVVGLDRQSRRSLHFSPSHQVAGLPPYACQTDLIRFDPQTGDNLWRQEFPGVRVGILLRNACTDVWSQGGKVGRFDLQTGASTLLYESPRELGSVVKVGSGLAVSWRARGEAGIDWLSERGELTASAAVRQSGVKSTSLHSTAAGLALQINHQLFHWFGPGTEAIWSAKAKPYIYRLLAEPATDLFVATDGNGGRLLAFDQATGRETLNLKPAIFGVAELTQVPGADLLVTPFAVSRSYNKPRRLLALSMKDRRHQLLGNCQALLGTWEQGAIYLSGADGRQLAIANLGELFAGDAG